MAKAKRAASGPNQELNRARAQITAAGGIHKGLARYKHTADIGEMRRILPLLVDHPAYRGVFWPDPMPRSYSRLGAGGIPALAGFERELIWCVQTLLPYARLISDFIAEKRRFEEALLRGDQENVWRLLEEIERRFGVSLWLAEANINALQTFKGYSAQQEYADAIARTKGAHPLVRYIVSWMSSRASQNIAAANFYALLDDMVPLESGFATLTHLILGDCRISNSKSAAAVLSFTDMLPVIDRYLVALAALQGYAATLRAGDPDLELLRRELTLLSTGASDPSLVRLSLVAGNRETIDTCPPLLSLIDDYVLGKYVQAADRASALLEEHCSIEALFILLKASRRLGEEVCPLSEWPASPLKGVAEDLWRIVNFGEDSNEAYTRLSKVILANASSAWAAALFLVVERCRSDGRVFGYQAKQVFFALRSAQEGPELAMTFARIGTSGSYLRALDGPIVASHATALVSASMANLGWRDGALVNIPQNRLLKWQAFTAIRVGRAVDAVDLLAPQYEAGDKRERSELGQAFAEGLLRAESLLRCAEVCVELFQSSNSFATVLPLDRLLSKLSARANELPIEGAFHGQLPVVLVFDIYSRFISANYDPERADAFKDFLLANGIRFASELINVPDQFPREHLVQFLKYVCVPEVLDQSLALDSTRAVEDERSRILVLLSELTAAEGKPPSSELLEELSTIKTRQVVRDATLELDQSKVYVNVDGIKKAVSPRMREMWGRYKLITSQQRGANLEELQKILEVALGERVAVFSLTLPLTEGNKLFTRIVSELLEMFSLSKEFGLDANLSTNIRHGFVMREIRGPLLARHLVTNKTSADGSYQENAYWMERLSDCYAEELSQVSMALAQFSEKVDAEIEHLNRRLIRIRSDLAPDGLFDFSIDDVSLQLLQRRCDKAESFDEFLDTIIEFLWGLTNSALERLRDVLFSITLANLYSAVDYLQDMLGGLVGSEDISALTSAASLVRPDLRSAIERVASWFTLSRSKEYQDYDLRVSYEAGLATVKSYYSHLNIVSEFESADVVMAGRTLPFFARLFSILLDNSAFHSGLASGTLLLRTKASLADGLLHLSARNNLARTVDLAFVRRQVDRINSDFGRERASNFIREEGGSGYPKIWKILAHDLGGAHAVQVSLTAAEEFLVEIMIEAKGIVV